jgi:hypothetical protein
MKLADEIANNRQSKRLGEGWLASALRFAISKMVELLKQVIRKRHSLFVNLVLELSLLGDASEIEVRNETPISAKIYLVIDEVHEAAVVVRSFSDLLASSLSTIQKKSLDRRSNRCRGCSSISRPPVWEYAVTC